MKEKGEREEDTEIGPKGGRLDIYKEKTEVTKVNEKMTLKSLKTETKR